MAREIRIVSFGSLDLTTGYRTDLMNERRRSLPDGRTQTVGTTGDWPSVTAFVPGQRPIMAGIGIAGGNVSGLRLALLQAFNQRAGVQALTIVDASTGENSRYLMCQCQAFQPQVGSSGEIYVATLIVDRDVRWRESEENQTVWNITASGDTQAVNNNGEDEAYPTFTIKPTSTRTGGFTYRRWIPFYWRAEVIATQYPVVVGGTSSLDLTGKCQSAGEDVRMFVNGVEVDRWFPETFYANNVRIWILLDFDADTPMTLKTAIDDLDTVEVIDVNEDITWMPDEGILVLVNGSSQQEAFTYTGRNVSLSRFTGVERAQKGSVARDFAVDDEVRWIQHDVWVQYGNATIDDKDQDDRYRPCFELFSSSNAARIYGYDGVNYWGYFGSHNGLRTGRWYGTIRMGQPEVHGYTDAHGGWSDPWKRIGGEYDSSGLPQRTTEFRRVEMWLYIFPPLGIYSIEVVNGEKYTTWDTTIEGPANCEWIAALIKSTDGYNWDDLLSVAAPTLADTWQTWNSGGDIVVGDDVIGVALKFRTGFKNVTTSTQANLEMQTVDLVIPSANWPEGLARADFPELGGYKFGGAAGTCILENQTTGEQVQIDYTLAVDEELVVDVEASTVTHLGISQMQALISLGDARRHWLPMALGSNTFKFTDVGTGNVTLTIDWRRRFFT